MALFKIFKGNDSAKITDSTVSGYRMPTDGYAYYDTSTKLFYIDADYNDNGTIQRYPINAGTATKLATGRTLTIGNTGKTFDGSENVSWSHIELGATVSNTWTGGTTAGPTIKTTVNGVTGTAVAIPSASKTASGIVTIGDQYFNGTKGFGYMARYGRTNTGAATRWVADTWLYNDAGTQVGEFWYDCGDATNITTGQYVWSQYSPNSTANTSTTGKKENYKLPVVASGLTENKSYNIITTKNPGDLYWANINVASSSSTTTEPTFGLIRSTKNSNTVTIGSQNANFCHIYNSANIPFIFNNTVATTTGGLGTTLYPWNDMYVNLSNGNSDFTDNTELLTSYASNNGFEDTNAKYKVYKRDAICMYNYIKTKASGTWGISITGNAATSSSLLYATQKTTAADLDAFHTANQLSACIWNGWSDTDKASASYPGVTNGIILDGGYNSTNYGFQIAIDDDPTGFIALRQKNTGGWLAWKRIPLGDGTGASGTWGITSTNTYNLLNYSGNECTLGSSSSATNTDLWINYRSGYNGSTSDSAAQLSNYYFGNRKGNITGVVVNSDRFVGNSRASSWIDGQRYAYAPYNIGNITDTSGYWPWMRATSTAASKWFSFGTLGTKFYWIGSSTSRTGNGYDQGMAYDIDNGVLQAAKVYGAVWNDYAEYRKDNPNENQEPGRCIKELGDGSLALTTKRLERGCEIVSDTFGFAIGQDEKNGYNTPIASNGRVLAYPYESIEEFSTHIGWPVCSGPNGTVSIMTEEEEAKYPSRIIGTISEIPDYEEWGTGKVKVNGRIWIRIR